VDPLGPINALTHASGGVTFQPYSLDYLWKSWTFQAEHSTHPYKDVLSQVAATKGAIAMVHASDRPKRACAPMASG